MVTYEHVNEVVRNRYVKHKAKRWDSRAIFLLIATSVGALMSMSMSFIPYIVMLTLKAMKIIIYSIMISCSLFSGQEYTEA